MKSLQKSLTIFLIVVVISSCHKESLKTNYGIEQPQPPTPPTTTVPPCANRPIIKARLEQIGSLSTPRSGMLCATAGNKILFVDGDKPGGTWWYDPSIIDIYDFVTNTWSNAAIYGGFRTGSAITAVGNKIFFAGGGDGVGDNQTSRVDIYNATTSSWSIAYLSIARMGLAAGSLGNKVFFAGGSYLNASAQWVDSDVIDIYDNVTNTWATAQLSEGRMSLSTSSSGNKLFFAGGRLGQHISNTVDIYDDATNSWSTSTMQESRAGMASIAVNNKIFWAGGITSSPNTYSNSVEIRDIVTGTSSLQCFIPRHGLDAVRKDDNIIFFTGDYNSNPYSGTHFEIYNITSDTWSTGELPHRINMSSIIAINNTIYVAGGISTPGLYNNQVWKLSF